MPVLTVIAGANGSGKSTFVAAMNLASIDPDRLAASYGEGFTDAANLRAAREALNLIAERVRQRQNLVIETTLAGRQPLRLMAQARAAGYQVHLVFIVPNSEVDTRLRIDNRVMLGGHNIPDADLERRATRILTNLPDAVVQADLTAFYLSSDRTQDFLLEGAVTQGHVQLTRKVPEGVLQSLARRFAINLVEAISQNHVVGTYFQSSIARQSSK